MCGDDEIGGGGTDCEPCGEGLVPNPAGTACQSCPYGESGTSLGLCAADPCGLAALDYAVAAALVGVNKEPRERGRAFFCLDDEIETDRWWSYAPASNACAVSVSMRYWDSCWTDGGSDGPCDLASIHTHPYFTEADRGTLCHRVPINEQRAIDYNNSGMEFSSSDLYQDQDWRVDGYLGVSDRSCMKANRITSGGSPRVEGTCTPTPLPHTPWSTP